MAAENAQSRGCFSLLTNCELREGVGSVYFILSHESKFRQQYLLNRFLRILVNHETGFGTEYIQVMAAVLCVPLTNPWKIGTFLVFTHSSEAECFRGFDDLLRSMELWAQSPYLCSFYNVITQVTENFKTSEVNELIGGIHR